MNKNESKENYELSQKQRGEFCFFFQRENVSAQSMLKQVFSTKGQLLTC